MKTSRLILIGFGSVHQALARLLIEKHEVLAQKYGQDFTIVGVADSSGATLNAAGLDVPALLFHKEAGQGVSGFAGGRSLPDARALVRSADYDALLEASSVNLLDGEPALGCVRVALARGKHVVLANKAPLVLDYDGLQSLARGHDAGLAFSATVCGGLPVINVARRDLVAAEMHQIEGIFNSTSNYILTHMAAGATFDAALLEAQRRGIAETDPKLDIEGWDTANKLVIIANAVLGIPAHLTDVAVTGIQHLSASEVQAARAEGMMVRLIATAQRANTGWQLAVKPQRAPLNSFLGGVDGWEMGIVFHTDIFEDIYMKIDERGPGATAAAMLRDVVNILRPSAS